jgi:hypothetical protein
MSKKLRVLHAPTEIASQAYLLTRGLRELGHKATTLDYRKNQIQNRKLDINFSIYTYPKIISWPLKLVLVCWALASFDIFHFHFGRTLIGNSEMLFRLLKKFNKKIVVHFHGSDIRDTKAIIQAANRGLVWEKKTPTTTEKQRLIKVCEKYADKVIVSTPDLLELINPDKVYWLPVSIEPELEKDYVDKTKRRKIVIVHAPSKKEVKGTNFIKNAVKNLNGVELVLMGKKPRGKVIEAIQKSNIVVDQVVVGWYGLLAVEAMTLGRPVVCFIRKGLQNHYGVDLPIISANSKNLRIVIGKLLNNINSLNNYALEGKKFAAREHNLKKNAKKVEKIYMNL